MLWSEATRWLDEALRHLDMPMLRYLQACSFIMGATGMETEAGVHVQAAGKLPFGPPFPWRDAEIGALYTLKPLFPNDERLAQYAALVGV
jgi:hypothetical protein